MTDPRPARRFEGLRRAVQAIPGSLALYQRLRPPPQAVITRWIAEGGEIARRYGLTEVALTPEGGFFRSPWGAEFVYVPHWGAYGAEHGVMHEEPELEHCASVIPQGATLLDVGANLGAFCLNLATRRADVRVQAFEPVAATCGYLRMNVARNGLGGRVTVTRAAVADRAGEMQITSTRHTDNHLVPAGAAAGGERVERVPVVALDEAVGAGAGPVGLIKVDVEGAELLVMRGAERILSEHRPALLLEVVEEHLARFGHSVAELEAHLAARGYRREHRAAFLTNNRFYVHTAGAPA